MKTLFSSLPVILCDDAPADGGAPQQELQKPAAEYLAEIESLKQALHTKDCSEVFCEDLEKKIATLKDESAREAGRILELDRENEALKIKIATQAATISNLTAAKAEADADEKLVLTKMGLGLSRPQAQAVVLRQKTYDLTPTGKKNSAKHAAFKAKQAAAATAETESAPQ